MSAEHRTATFAKPVLAEVFIFFSSFLQVLVSLFCIVLRPILFANDLYTLTRPEKSLHFLVKSPDSNLHFLVSPEIALHLITG